MPFFVRANHELPMTVLPHYDTTARGRNNTEALGNDNEANLKRKINIYNVNELTLNDIKTMERVEYAMQKIKKVKTSSTTKPTEEQDQDSPVEPVAPIPRREKPIVPGNCKTLGEYVIFKARPGFFQRGPSATDPSVELQEGAAVVHKRNQSGTSCAGAATSSIDVDASPLDGDAPLAFKRMPSTVC